VRLYTWRRVRLTDEVGTDAMADAADDEGDHWVARPEGVIHRYIFKRTLLPHSFLDLDTRSVYTNLPLVAILDWGSPELTAVVIQIAGQRQLVLPSSHALC
jgi:hypothetical protein